MSTITGEDSIPPAPTESGFNPSPIPGLADDVSGPRPSLSNLPSISGTQNSEPVASSGRPPRRGHSNVSNMSRSGLRSGTPSMGGVYGNMATPVRRARSSLGGSQGGSMGVTPGTSQRLRGHRADLGWDGDRRESLAMSSPMGIADLPDAGEAIPEAVIWGTNVRREYVARQFIKFIREFMADDEGAEEEDQTMSEAEGVDQPEKTKEPKYISLIIKAVNNRSFIVDINCAELDSFDPDLYSMLIQYPAEVLLIFDEVVDKLAREVGDPSWTAMYQNICPMVTRPYNLKETKVIRDLDPTDMNKLISVKGMITRTSGIIPEMRNSFFKCQKPLCAGKAEVLTNTFGHITEPGLCPLCQSKFSFSLIHNRCGFIDKQMVKMQENPSSIPEGETPHLVTLFAMDANVDQCSPGDRVTVTGIYRAVPVRISPIQSILSHMFKTHIDIIHTQRDERGQLFSLAAKTAAAKATDNEDTSMAPSQSEANPPSQSGLQNTQDTSKPNQYHDGGVTDAALKRKREEFEKMAADPDLYDKLTNSVAPNIFGMEELKRGILCQLFGGVSKSFPGGRIRGDINMLLVGDPGVSKSQLLSWTHKTAPRGIYTSGRGSSAVGLTAYVTKDPETKEMVLESGALVLSDKGVCCIDEFDKMSDNARSMLHEVMEQQTVSVAKAGLISVLNARTSVLASANPIGSRFDDTKNLVDNINLPPTLLSRFDLIFKVLDVVDRDRDKRLARHLVAMYYPNATKEIKEGLFDQQTMREYVAYARSQVTPKLTAEAGKELEICYTRLRKTSADADIVGVTPRQLESLIRLSEAQAKMRLCKEVTVAHVQEAHRLWWAAMTSAAQQQNGRIDFNLITTGVSMDEAEQMTLLVEPLEAILKEAAERGRRAWSLKEVGEELEKHGHHKPSERTLSNILMSMSHLLKYDAVVKRVTMR